MGLSAATLMGQGYDSDMFLQLLIEQLKNQNPMDPIDNSDMVAQVAQLATIEGMDKLNASFADVLKLQEFSSGTDMIGREVEFWQGDSVCLGTVQALSNYGDGEGVRLMVEPSGGTEGSAVTPVRLDDVLKVY